MKHNDSKQSRARIAASLGILALAALAACGDNGFLPPSQSNRPEVDALEMGADSATLAGDTIPEGDTLWINLEASGTRTINRVRLRFTGAIVDDTTFSMEESGQQVEGVIWVPIPPQTGPDSMLYADVSVIDAATLRVLHTIPVGDRPWVVTLLDR